MTHTNSPVSVGCERPYILCTTAGPSQTARTQFMVCFGKPTGGCGWPALSYETMAANAQRIADCWNGCLTIGNPAEIPRLVSALRDVLISASGAEDIDAYAEIPWKVLATAREALRKAVPQ